MKKTFSIPQISICSFCVKDVIACSGDPNQAQIGGPTDMQGVQGRAQFLDDWSETD